MNELENLILTNPEVRKKKKKYIKFDYDKLKNFLEEYGNSEMLSLWLHDNTIKSNYINQRKGKITGEIELK